MYYIFPDIHGQYQKLETMLKTCGFTYQNGTWKHPEATALFLGDFIDRGPENGKVLDTVRGMIENDQAQAVMGNHELNAILYHTTGQNGDGLRPRNDKNTRQHASFLAEFPLFDPKTAHQIAFLKTLPLAKDLKDLRMVHACWDDKSLNFIQKTTGSLLLQDDDLETIGDEHSPLGRAVERITKGPELALPKGYGIHDKEGVRRTRIRVKWWEHADTWKNLAMSVIDDTELPDGKAAMDDLVLYPQAAPPVFFGHYWLTGTPIQQSPNALCMDYSAGLEGPLLAYKFTGGPISLDNILTN